MITERKAGQFANQVHDAYGTKQITLREAINLLEKIGPYLSTTQFYKLMDLQDHARYNPNLLDEKK
jgi:hypothetical protein